MDIAEKLTDFDINTLISRLRFRHLKLIIALDEFQTVQRAAEEVALTQPGATKSLNEIESIFGHALFTRTNRGLQTTALGECLVSYSRLVLNDIKHLKNSMQGVINGHGGNLSVGVIMGAVPLITQTLTDIYKVQPDVSIEVIEDTSQKLLLLLEKGSLDVVIGRVKASLRPHLFESAAIHSETLFVVAHPKHPMANLKELTLKDLEKSRWVLYPADMPMRKLIEREFHENSISIPLYPIETASAFTTITMMQTDHKLVALMSKDAATPFIQNGMICKLGINIQSRSEEYELITLKDSPREPIVNLFIKKITEAGNLKFDDS